MHLIVLHDTAGWLFTGPKFLYMRSTPQLLKASLAFILPNINYSIIILLTVNDVNLNSF